MNISETIYKQICVQLNAIKPHLDVQIVRKLCNITHQFSNFNFFQGCHLEIAYANINRFMLRASAENKRTMSGLHSLVLEKLD